MSGKMVAVEGTVELGGGTVGGGGVGGTVGGAAGGVVGGVVAPVVPVFAEPVVVLGTAWLTAGGVAMALIPLDVPHPALNPAKATINRKNKIALFKRIS
jgi:hypothetical protein